MRFVAVLFLGLISLLGARAEVEAGFYCETPTRFCFETDLAFTAMQNDVANIPRACLDSSPNPAWFWFELAATDPSNYMEFTISMVEKNDPSTARDVDFAVFGPFSDLTEAIQQCGTLDDNDKFNDYSLLAQDSDSCGEICDACSFATAENRPVETARINAGNVGDVYLMLVTNFANVDGIITIAQTTNAQTECGCNSDDLCLDLETAQNCPQDCDNVDNMGGICGDDVCQGEENDINCPRDCGDVIHYWGFAATTLSDGTADDIEVNIHGNLKSSGWYTISTATMMPDTESFMVLALEAVFVGQVERFEFRVSGGDSWQVDQVTVTAPGNYVYRLGSVYVSSSTEYSVSTPSLGYWDITTTTASKVILGQDRAGTVHAIFMYILGSADNTGWILLTGNGFTAGSAVTSRFYFSWDIGTLVSHSIYIMGNTDGWLFYSFGWYYSWGASYSFVAQIEEWWGYHDEYNFFMSSYSREYIVTFAECGTLIVNDAQVSYISGTTYYGSTATFECNTDFVLDGSDNECLCLANGMWECGGSCLYAPPPSSSPSPTGKPNTPTSSATRSPSMKPSSTPSPTATSTRTPSSSRTPSRSRSLSSSMTPTRTPSPSSSVTPTASISLSPSPSSIVECTPTPEPCGCGCGGDCGCCDDGPLTRININFDRMFRGINF
jgi:hypothetical protein